MPNPPFRCLFAAGLLAWTGCGALAQTNTPPTAPPAVATSAPVPVPLPDVVTRAQGDTETLKDAVNQTTPDILAQSVHADLPALIHKVDMAVEDDKRLLESSPTLSNLQIAQAAWTTLAATLDDAQDSVSARVRDQHTLLAKLNDLDKTWQATADSASKAKAPAEIVQSIEQVRARSAETRKALLEDLNDLYSLQVLIADQSDRSRTGRDAIDRAIGLAQAQLFERTFPALWEAAALTDGDASAMGRERLTLFVQLERTGAYLREKTGALLVHGLILALLLAACLRIRKVTAEQAKTEEGLRQAAHVFDVPVTTALLLALVASRWLYPPVEAPRLLWALIGAVALVPAVIIVRRLISHERLPLLYGTVVAYFIDQVRYAATPAGVLARLLLLIELIAVCLFIIIVLRRVGSAVVTSPLAARIVRVYLHGAFFVFLASGFANVLGYVPLGFLIGNGMLEASYLAVIFYAGVRVLDALIIAAMSLPPVSRFGMVRRHHDLVYKKVAALLRWVTTGVWVVLTLEIFSLGRPIWDAANSLLWTHYSIGALHDLQLGSVLAFPLIVWAAFTLSRLIRFALEEDVYPNLLLPRGIPYAISTIIHYAILVVGFFMALSALGIDLSSYAVLAGAFGVGLGFGLQNILNNFMSGLILLFERPIKVGDTVQTDANTIGRVERIGIRASVILLTNGAELIVPNGNLISSPITNWTLSNCERLLEIPVSIAPRSDARHAMEVLILTAKANSAVLKNPPPQATVSAFSAASLGLKLRCWVDAEEDWNKLTSELTLAVLAALEKEQISLA